MECSQRLLQIVVFRIAVLPYLGCGMLHSLHSPRRRAKHALVGTNPCPELSAARTLLGLRPDKRNHRGKTFDSRCKVHTHSSFFCGAKYTVFSVVCQRPRGK